MKRHDYQKGELVWWTMGDDEPLLRSSNELYLGIITAIAKNAGGVEVFWFHNDSFKIMNYESIMRAKANFI